MSASRKKSFHVGAGSLLLAHPSLGDENFHRTVIFMSEHDEDGSMGVVLNRPKGKLLGEIEGEFALGPLAGVPVFIGGPVQTGRLLLAAWEVREDGFRVHFGLEPSRAEELLRDPEVEVRAFLGYAGWTGGQLEDELAQNTWIVAAMPAGLMAQPADVSLWRRVLGGQGEEWRLLADEPDDTSLN